MKSISSSFDKVQKKKAFQYVKIIFSSNLKVIFLRFELVHTNYL